MIYQKVANLTASFNELATYVQVLYGCIEQDFPNIITDVYFAWSAYLYIHMMETYFTKKIIKI